MKIGLVGLGKMGFNMRERLRAHGLEVIGYDPRPEVTDVGSLAELAASLEGPRVVWVMVPAGDITQSTIAELADALEGGDLVIDGWKLSLHRRRCPCRVVGCPWDRFPRLRCLRWHLGP